MCIITTTPHLASGNLGAGGAGQALSRTDDRRSGPNVLEDPAPRSSPPILQLRLHPSAAGRRPESAICREYPATISLTKGAILCQCRHLANRPRPLPGRVMEITGTGD